MRSVAVRPKHGYYPLSPKQLLLRSSLQYKGGEESKAIEINSLDKITDIIPEGKDVLPDGKVLGN